MLIYCSKLQEETKQLSGSLESTIVKLCTVKSENERLESEAEKQKTKEEGLVCLLQQKEKELLELQEMEKKFSELQQDYDIMCQRLKDVARVATVSDMHGVIDIIVFTAIQTIPL